MRFCFLSIGLEQLKEEIKETNDGNTSIKTLCTRNKDEVKFLSLKAASPLDYFAAKFNYLKKSTLFNKVWNEHMKDAKEANLQVEIRRIKTTIWNPSFQKCQKLLCSICDKTISLSEVDDYFDSTESTKHIRQHILVLHHGISSCVSGYKKDVDYIDHAVRNIEKYWLSCRRAKAARILIRLRDELKLGGDFTEALQVSKAMYCMTLSRRRRRGWFI